MRQFRELLEQTEGITDTISWRDARVLLKQDPRYDATERVRFGCLRAQNGHKWRKMTWWNCTQSSTRPVSSFVHKEEGIGNLLV